MTKKDEARKTLPGRACKKCVDWYRHLNLTNDDRIVVAYQCPRCALNQDEVIMKLKKESFPNLKIIFCEALIPESTPSEAWGYYEKLYFYFRARGNHWEFTMSPNRDIDPCDLVNIYHMEEKKWPKHFSKELINEYSKSFVKTVYTDCELDNLWASEMPEKEIKKILTQCISEFENKNT